MSDSLKEIGNRLKAYRLGSKVSSKEISERLGISRAAVYRIEAGEVVKIETLERLAGLLDTSIASLLGVGVEYYAKAISYFERMRQLEEQADQIVAHFEPLSYLLTTDNYTSSLRQMLTEGLPPGLEQNVDALAEIEAVLTILAERKEAKQRRRFSIVDFVTVPEIERFLELGLIGRFDLPVEERARRRAAARAEVENLIKLMADEPMGIQIGLVADAMPNITFQLFRMPNKTMLAVSPFRLGEQPNIRLGVATVTGAAEPVGLYERLVETLWSRAMKGERAVAFLRKIVDRFDARLIRA